MSLLPIAAYLTGAIEMLWKIGVAIGQFGTGFVFSPTKWVGIGVTGLAIALFLAAGGRQRAQGRQGDAQGRQGRAGRRAAEAGGRPPAAGRARRGPTRALPAAVNPRNRTPVPADPQRRRAREGLAPGRAARR